MDDAAPPIRRRSRFWLFAPFAVVAFVILAWCLAWFVIRARTEEGIDAWLAREAAAGRQWTCADRSVDGFPFRVEVGCSEVSLRRGDLTAAAGRFQAVAQIYQPRHVIVQLAGPLRVAEAGVAAEGRWRLFEASVRSSREGLRQLSAVMTEAAWQVTGPAPEPLAGSAARLEIHARPSPARDDDALDIVARAGQAAVPLLDRALGTPEPADLELQARATRSLRLVGEPVAAELERWRESGGALDIVLLKLVKGAGRLEARGRLGLDPEHRVEGRIEGAAAGADTVLRALLGDGRAGLAAGLLGALAGRAGRPQGGSDAALQPLPPLRLENGRVFLGPLPVPGVRLTPLY